MNLTLDIQHLIPRAPFEGLIDALGGDALQGSKRARKDALRTLDAALPESARPAFITYSDAASEDANTREHAVVRVGLLLGLGTGVAMQAHPDQPPAALARVAADVVAVAISSEVGPTIATDVARLVLRALALVAEEAAAG